MRRLTASIMPRARLMFVITERTRAKLNQIQNENELAYTMQGRGRLTVPGEVFAIQARESREIRGSRKIRKIGLDQTADEYSQKFGLAHAHQPLPL